MSYKEKARQLGLVVIEDDHNISFYHEGERLETFAACGVKRETLDTWLDGYAKGCRV